MSKKIYVTSAQRKAAQYIVERDASRGRETRAAVKKIADATPAPSASTTSASATATAQGR